MDAGSISLWWMAPVACNLLAQSIRLSSSLPTLHDTPALGLVIFRLKGSGRRGAVADATLLRPFVSSFKLYRAPYALASKHVHHCYRSGRREHPAPNHRIDPCGRGSGFLPHCGRCENAVYTSCTLLGRNTRFSTVHTESGWYCSQQLTDYRFVVIERPPLASASG
jgi:hypothetical protein